MDTLGHRLALHVAPADRGDRAHVDGLCEAVRRQTGGNVGIAFVDQDYIGEAAADAASGIELRVVRLPGVKGGFVLLPRRWVVERTSAWLARDHERLAKTAAGLN